MSHVLRIENVVAIPNVPAAYANVCQDGCQREIRRHVYLVSSESGLFLSARCLECRCFSGPNCPLANPPGPVQEGEIKYCEAKKNGTCGSGEFCHNWWRSTPENNDKVDSYSLCCAKPSK